MKTEYVIVQHRIEPDENGVPKIKEALLAHPDSHSNALRRIMKWQTVLEMENLRLRKAEKEDYPKKRAAKKRVRRSEKKVDDWL